MFQYFLVYMNTALQFIKYISQKQIDLITFSKSTNLPIFCKFCFFSFLKSFYFLSKPVPLLQFLLHSFLSLSCPTFFIFHPSSQFHHHLLHSFQQDKHFRQNVELALLQIVGSPKGRLEKFALGRSRG